MKQSAGILLFSKTSAQLQVLLVHPGGPFWKSKDLGAWSIPKGEFTDEENPLEAAIREFKEETGVSISGDFIALGSVKLKSGKIIHAWALEQYLDPDAVTSNTFEMEWPPKSGKRILVPEVDKAGWFLAEQAVLKLNAAQAAFVERLVEKLTDP